MNINDWLWLSCFFEAFCDGGIEIQVAFGLRNNHMPNWGCIHRPNLGGFTEWFGATDGKGEFTDNSPLISILRCFTDDLGTHRWQFNVF